jgi:hypothetical protein
MPTSLTIEVPIGFGRWGERSENPWLENLEPADRTVVTPLPRRHLARGPGRANAADEDKTGITRRRHLDGQLPFADFTLSNHVSIQ